MTQFSRRTVLAGTAGLLGAAAAGSAAAQQKAQLATPPSVVSNPARRWGRGADPAGYPDPDVIRLDPSAAQIFLGASTIRRVHTGLLWAEGPSWSNQGQYLVFSDVRATQSTATSGTMVG